MSDGRRTYHWDSIDSIGKVMGRVLAGSNQDQVGTRLGTG
jgi:hypothetical protein